MDKQDIHAYVMDVITVHGNNVILMYDRDVDFNKDVTYFNVRGFDTEDRGRVFHKLKFENKINKGSEYYYIFEITGPEGYRKFEIHNKVTIMPLNTSRPIILKCDSESKRITFKVENSGLYNLQKTYVIQSDCLDNRDVKGTAKCVDKDNTKKDGPTVTFELSHEDYDKLSGKSHCVIKFAETGWNPFATPLWFHFKKSKSLKKRTKTVVKKTYKRRLASPKCVVKSVKKTTKRSRPVKKNK